MKKLLLGIVLSMALVMPLGVKAASYNLTSYQWGSSVYLNASISGSWNVLRDVKLVYEVNGSGYSETVALKNFGSWGKVIGVKHGSARFKVVDYKYGTTSYSNWVRF